MNKTQFFIVNIIFFLSIIVCDAQNNHSVMPNDTLTIFQSKELPVVDGKLNDQCWNNIQWQPIDQPWIPYGDSVSRSDFSGEYKILWSKKTNLLYFVVKITDDVFVDGYRYNSDPKKGDFYYDHDMLEIFIDEDQSGGMHVFDGVNETGKEWGTNSANAFSYHVILNSPKENHTSRTLVACDLAGKSWDNYCIANYADHFHDFALHKQRNEYIWEFSIKVYNDRYIQSDKEKSRVQLTPNKRMGISLAYCDNDDQNEIPKARDNFFGSVVVQQNANNDHWKNADGYRKAILSEIVK
jgi:hypothetical protein